MVRLLVGTHDGLVELDASGTTTTQMEGCSIGAVAEDGERWWALVDGAEVWHSGPDRTRWQRSAVAPDDDTRLTCLLPRPGGLLVGTSGAHLLRLDGPGGLTPVGAFDHLECRGDWYTPWGGPPDTRSLASEDGAVFVGVHVGGIVASSDGGRSWRQTSLDIHADVHQVLVVPDDPGQVLSACAEGLAVGDDHGATWRIDDEGLHATYARALAVAGDTVVVSASDGPGGDHACLYRRPVTGRGPFERCREGLPEWFDDNIDTGCLVAAGATVAAATPAGDVWRSDDRGLTWRQSASTLSAAHCLALAD